MDKLKFATLLRRELRAVLRLAPWVLVSLLLAAALWRTDLAAVSGLFQSPPSATATSEPPTATPTEEPTALATETPTVELPTDTPTPEATVPPTVPPAATSSATALPTATLEPSPTPGETTPEPTTTTEVGTEDSRYNENADLAFDWGTLFDSVALGVSYLWLCCGILLLFAVPVTFVVLWVASKRREAQEE